MIRISKQIHVGGVLTDADSTPLLTDATGTYGIKDVDGDVIVAAGVAMTRQSTGIYYYDFTPPSTGSPFTAALKFVVAGNTVYEPETIETVNGSWVNADVQECIDLIGTDNLAALSNFPNETADELNNAVIVRAGKWSDSIIHGKLGGMFEIPLTDLDDDATAYIRNISAELTVWKLNHQKLIQSRQLASENDVIDFQMYREWAESDLKSILTGAMGFSAKRLFGQRRKAFVVGTPTTLVLCNPAVDALVFIQDWP